VAARVRGGPASASLLDAREKLRSVRRRRRAAYAWHRSRRARYWHWL